MTQLAASLRFADLSAVLELLMSLSSTGRLHVTSGDSVGELELREGRVVGASLGNARGLAALESIAVGLFDGNLTYADAAVAADHEPVLPEDMQQPYLKRLCVERARFQQVIGSLQKIPRLSEGAPDERTLLGNVTVGADSLQLIPWLVHGHSLEMIARSRGLARTLRGVYGLVRAGLVRLDDSPAAARANNELRDMRSAGSRLARVPGGRNPSNHAGPHASSAPPPSTMGARTGYVARARIIPTAATTPTPRQPQSTAAPSPQAQEAREAQPYTAAAGWRNTLGRFLRP